MSESKQPEVRRADRFVLAIQLERLCAALQLAVENHEQPGTTTAALLNKFRNDLLQIVPRGKCKEELPEVDENASAIDMLALAESIRGVVLAFLTPDESQERGSFGFKRPR